MSDNPEALLKLLHHIPLGAYVKAGTSHQECYAAIAALAQQAATPQKPHGKDNEPCTPECKAALNFRGDDKGQGLAPYWKWAFKAGWNARQAATPVPAEPVAWLNYDEAEANAGRFPWALMVNRDHPAIQSKTPTNTLYAAPPATPAAQPADGWIAVADRLPEPATDVLVYVNDRRIICVAGIFNGFWQSLDRPWRGMSVTHWRPLPAAPNEGSKA